MTQYGKYNPNNPDNSSGLFSFQEIPVTSAKLNRWNGNVATAFETLQSACAQWISRKQKSVMTGVSDDSLKVIPRAPLGMAVRVKPGWAVFEEGFAGLTQETVIPFGGFVVAPRTNPRIDVVILRSCGTIEILQGEEAPVPQSPEIPEEALPLAELVLPVRAGMILEYDNGSDGYIRDIRPCLSPGEAHTHGVDRAPLEAADGLRTSFSTTQTFQAESLDVFVNGVLQQADLDYEILPGRKGYRFFVPPSASSQIQHRYRLE